MTQEKVTYDQEFKDNAAKYCIEKATSITQGAKDLGINKCSIFRWVNEWTLFIKVDTSSLTVSKLPLGIWSM